MADTLPWDQFKPQTPVNADQTEPVLVIGAGLAGCWIARTLAESGIPVLLLEAGPSAACGASSNPAGIAKPYVTRGPSLAMKFYTQAHHCLRRQLCEWKLEDKCSYTDSGVVQLVENPYDPSDQFNNLSGQQMQDAMGMSHSGYGLLFADAGWLNPSALCNCLLDHDKIDLRTNSPVQAIVHGSDARWRVKLSPDKCIQVNHVVIASGVAINKLDPAAQLDIVPARGQISRFACTNPEHAPKHVISGKKYLIPDGNSVLVGATFERNSLDASVRIVDDEKNLSGLARMLPQLQVDTTAVEAFAGIRATTPDRLPLVGPVPDAEACAKIYADLRHGRCVANYPRLPIHSGLFILGGLGSRGIVTAPFAASLLADYMTGGKRINQWASLLNPARFQIRRLKRSMTV